MASRILAHGARAFGTAQVPLRTFSTSRARLDAIAAAPLPARRPVGAIRGGLFGFFLGSTVAGGAVYYYAIQEYKTSNDLLTEDIYALQKAVERLSQYVSTLEDKTEALERKKK